MNLRPLALAVLLLGCRPPMIFVPIVIHDGPVDHGSHQEERRLTARATGCDAHGVVIRDHVFGFWRSTWAAQCGARRFRCAIDWPPVTCAETNEPLPMNVERG